MTANPIEIVTTNGNVYLAHSVEMNASEVTFRTFNYDSRKHETKKMLRELVLSIAYSK